MGLCRIYYRMDGSVAISHPVLNANKTPLELLDAEMANFSEVRSDGKPDERLGLSYEDMDASKLPTNRVDREKWRKHPSGKGVHVDNSVTTTAELRKADEDALDIELAKATPDPVVVIDLDRKLKKGVY